MIQGSRYSFVPYPTGLLRMLVRSPLAAYQFGLGDLLNAGHLMVLTTRGRKSGLPRHVPIEYRRHGSKIYLLSVWGDRPDWYRNLITDPLATVQLGRKSHSVLADPVTDPAEALRAVHLFRRIAPGRYDAILGRMIEDNVNAQTLPELSGEFTIMRLNLIPDEPVLPGLPVNLTWIWPFAVALLLVAAVFISLGRGSRSEVEKGSSL